MTDYSYNARNELTGADHSDVNNPDETYDYDANGNRVSSSRHGTDYDTGTNNQLLADGVYTYDYDDVGNLIRQSETGTGDVRSFEWDYLNCLVAVIDQDNLGEAVQRVEYTYDVRNRRIAKTVDIDGADSIAPETLNFVYDRDNVLLEFEGGSTDPSQRYLHGPRVDQVLAQEDATGDTLWHLSDHLGTVKDLVDDTGTVVNHRTYDSYGNLVAETDSSFDSRYGFTGREFDEETGLNYYRARYYNGEVGRFISEDPIGFGGQDTNLLRYVNNNPVLFSDPSGLFGQVASQARFITYTNTGNLSDNEAVFTFPTAIIPNQIYYPRNSSSPIFRTVNSEPPISRGSDFTRAFIRHTDTPTPRREREPWGGLYGTDDSGHIIPVILGGASEEYNLFSHNMSINRGGYNVFGVDLVNYLDRLDGNPCIAGEATLRLEVDLLHDGNNQISGHSLRPTEVAVTGRAISF